MERLYLSGYGMNHKIWIGTFEDGKFVQENETEAVPNPSYLLKNKDLLYAVSEVQDYQERAGKEIQSSDQSSKDSARSAVFASGALAVLDLTANGQILQTASTEGADPCHLQISPDGRLLAAANYSGGSVCFFNLDDAGRISGKKLIQFHGKGPNHDRQEKAHAHYIWFSQDGTCWKAVDLGSDKVCHGIINRTFTGDPLEGVQEQPGAALPVPAGAGPRHFVTAQSEQRIYLLTELSNQVLVYQNPQKFQGQKGALCSYNLIQQISTLPGEVGVYAADSSAGAIRISKNERFLYVSNRGHDSLTVYEISVTSGALTFLQNISCEGRHPRDIALNPGEDYLLCANQNSNGISVFNRDTTTGLLSYTGITHSYEKPSCILFDE